MGKLTQHKGKFTNYYTFCVMIVKMHNIGKDLHNIWVFTQLMGKFTQSLHVSCNDGCVNKGYGQRLTQYMGKFTQHMGKFTQLLHILCNDCANMKMQQKVLICKDIMHQLWLKQEL